MTVIELLVLAGVAVWNLATGNLECTANVSETRDLAAKGFEFNWLADGSGLDLLKKFKAERPDVILSYDESRGYEHPDHVRVHEWGIRAFREAGDPDKFPEVGEPWAPSKLYYFATFSKQRMQKLSDAADAEGIEHPYAGWLKNWDTMGFEDPEITTQVDVADYIETRSKALLGHATQIDPDSFWFAIPDELQKKVYPWEDYTLVESHVESELPETDLFDGIGVEAQ